MAIYKIPLKAVPSQIVTFTIQDANYVAKLRQLGGRQFLSLSTGDQVLINSALLVSDSPLIDSDYKGLNGEFFVNDLLGKSRAPEYTGWGTEWELIFKNDE